jgi:exopolyphosphatase/guanosine-5'-triphosphate,3'-diphosphate pyrophosphatase
VRCACIDIGSNTTRLLVADHAGGTLVPVVQLRAFTRLGRACRAGGALPQDVIEGLAQVVAAQAREAREADASALRVVATAALRRAANGAEVCDSLRAAAGVTVELLSEVEEARLAFAGATRASASADAVIGVVDVGGGSSELIVGTPAGGVTWSRSLPLGSGDLADAHLRSDPPAADELDAIRVEVAAALAGVEIPPVTRAVAVGGSATSLRRLVGPLLDADALAATIDGLAALPAERVAVVHDLDPVRVRLLPAGILVLAAVAARMGPLTVAEGGLREGVVLELAGAV